MEISSTRPLRAVALALVAALALLLPAAPASADGEILEITAQVHGKDGTLAGPLAGVRFRVEKWVWLENEWEAVTNENNSSETDANGYFTVSLEADAEYTLRFEAHGPYPTQYLGGGPSAPSGPNAADWKVATFSPGDWLSEPPKIKLALEPLFSASGLVAGDEDGADLSGTVDVFEITGDSVSEDDYFGTSIIEDDGLFLLDGLHAGQRYTVRASSGPYLQTFLGNTTQRELADSFTVNTQGTAIEEIALRRGATVEGVVTSAGAPVSLAHVTAMRWDPAGERWLEPTHYDETAMETGADGTWQRNLEPGATYTLFVDTSYASTVGEVPASQFLAGGIVPPAPVPGAATFELLPSGLEVPIALVFPPIELSSAPAVSGRAEVGSTLSSSTGTWTVAGVEVTKQWLREGEEIPGATGTTYTPTTADIGERLSVRVAVSKQGYSSATVTTASTPPVADVTPPAPDPEVTPPAPVEKARSTTTLSLSRTTAKYGTKVRATVRVRSTAGTPSGRVTLRLGTKVIGVKSPTVKGTTATVKFDVPRSVKTGTHRLTATTAATSSVVASTSKTQRLKVTKAKATVKVKGPKKWRLTKGKRPSLTVTVKGTKGGPTPRGKVVVKIGKKKYTKTLKAGKVKVRGPKLTKRGSVKVRITYRPAAKTYAKPKAVKKTLRVR